MKRYGYIFITLFIIVIAIALFPSEKKRIKKVIYNCKEAVIMEDIADLMEYISFNYNDEYGGSYLQLKKRVELTFKRFHDFDISIDIMKIAIDGKGATTDLEVSVIASEGNERGYLVGDAGGPQDVKVYFEKSAYEWQVVKIEGVIESEKDLYSIILKE